MKMFSDGFWAAFNATGLNQLSVDNILYFLGGCTLMFALVMLGVFLCVAFFVGFECWINKHD